MRARNDSLQKVIFEPHFLAWSKVWFIRSRRAVAERASANLKDSISVRANVIIKMSYIQMFCYVIYYHTSGD